MLDRGNNTSQTVSIHSFPRVPLCGSFEVRAFEAGISGLFVSVHDPAIGKFLEFKDALTSLPHLPELWSLTADAAQF